MNKQAMPFAAAALAAAVLSVDITTSSDTSEKEQEAINRYATTLKGSRHANGTTKGAFGNHGCTGNAARALRRYQ